MIKLTETVVVEGRYDKSKLSSIIDANIIELGGYRIFKDKEMLALLRRLAKENGLIIFTDSDMAGFKIRNYLKGAIKEGKITHVYIPDIPGKEHRKASPSAEGTLGVEGVPKEVIMDALAASGVISCTTSAPTRLITKQDFITDGISGADNSSDIRRALLEKLSLPKRLSSNSLVSVLNSLMSYEEYSKILEKVKDELGR